MNKFNMLKQETDDCLDLYIYGDIVASSWKWYESDVTSYDVKEIITSRDNLKTINVHINSCGGDVYEGLAIFNLLKAHKATVNVYVDGIAASIASVIAMAGDKIVMTDTSLMMIHNCYVHTRGNSKELRKTADDMEKVMEACKEAYRSQIKITDEELDKLLDEETFLTAKECIEKGFATEVIKITEEKEVLSANLIYTKLKDKLDAKDKEIKALKEKLEDNPVKEMEKKESTEKVEEKTPEQKIGKESSNKQKCVFGLFFNGINK